MMNAVLHGRGLYRDNIFDPLDPGNRDDCFYPYIELRSCLAKKGIHLRTSDQCINADIVLHLNAENDLFGKYTYLLALEPSTIRPEHANLTCLKQYHKVFTWDDSLVDGRHFVKINFSNRILIPTIDGFIGRDIFACMIAGNKVGAIADPRDLYAERLRVIRWFERHVPDHFHLYGVGWDLLKMRRGLFGQIIRRLPMSLLRRIGWRPFPSYRGQVARKHEVLLRSRFSFCYENTNGPPGYVTEKLFDSLFAGCVPVYWGAPNIMDYVPRDCFIDRRDFSDTAEVYRRLQTMTESEYKGYQAHIIDFLRSSAAQAFEAKFFARTIADTIADDLRCDA